MQAMSTTAAQCRQGIARATQVRHSAKSAMSLVMNMEGVATAAEMTRTASNALNEWIRSGAMRVIWSFL